MEKACSFCKEFKPVTTAFFNKQPNGKYGLSAHCRTCHAKRMKGRNKAAYALNPIKGRLHSLRKLDDKAGRDFDLTEEWVREHISPKPCTYCGETGPGISTDRIDNALGHTTVNVIPSCRICNVVRNNIFTVDEMKLLGAVIARIKAAR